MCVYTLCTRVSMRMLAKCPDANLLMLCCAERLLRLVAATQRVSKTSSLTGLAPY